MEKTWRWFGEKDSITLDMLRQIGVEGIVTALHDVPNGEIWQKDKIVEVREYIQASGMHWSVVESLPVCEAIKFGGPERDRLIDNYIASLSNLGEAGIKTVCYNFMPVIDWIRTDLDYRLPDGTSTLYFNYAGFAYFDCRILGRAGAEKDYPDSVLEKVAKLSRTLSAREKQSLIDTIIVKTQGFVNGNISEKDDAPVRLFRQLLEKYDGIGRKELRQNLKYFLDAVMPVCDRYGIDMCVHPDDPPCQVLGLPRIISSEEDLAWLVGSVGNRHNGITFCAGSLSAGPENNVPGMAARFKDRVHFVHLRSTDILPGGDFIEAPHTAGRGHIVDLVRIFENMRPDLPMRVDHGRLMLGDREKNYNPGYSFYGRMYALAQVDGIMAAVRNEMDNPKFFI